MKLRVLLEGAGAAILLLLPYLYDHLSLSHLYDVYHQLLPVNTVARGLLIDLVVVCLVCTAIFFLSDKLDPSCGKPIHAIWVGIFIWRIGIDLLFILENQGLVIPYSIYFRKPLLLVSIASLVFLWKVRRSWYLRILYITRKGILLASFCLPWILLPLVLVAKASQPNDISLMRKPVPSKPSGRQNRIIWILLDELSYDQAFEHRQPGIQLPNLDRIRKESVEFTNVQPVGYFTDRIIPSLFLGRPILDIRSSVEGNLSIFPSDTHKWEQFDPQATLFAEAKRQGWATGVVGWYNPYCRILTGVLDSCYWKEEIVPSGYSGKKSSLTNALPLLITPPSLTPKIRAASQALMRAHAATEDNVLPEAIQLIQDEKIRFAFIHIPLPHPLGIYDRKLHRIQEGGSYLDNLVFADDVLGVLINELNKTSSVQRTTLVISSDHSWRIPLWSKQPGWTKEDEQASQGRFDPRPVLMIRFPGQESTRTILQPFPEIRVNEMIQAMLENKLSSPIKIGERLGN